MPGRAALELPRSGPGATPGPHRPGRTQAAVSSAASLAGSGAPRADSCHSRDTTSP
jgi:hypothetical protein